MEISSKSIVIIGLPGSGKTELAKELSSRLHAIHWNADTVRQTINSDLGFTNEDRIEQARRMKWLALNTKMQGFNTIVDFICPTKETRESLELVNFDIIIWMNRTPTREFKDTSAIWEDPMQYHIKFDDGLSVKEEADMVISQFGLFDYQKPTTLMLGRYQPWHEGHSALYQEAKKRTDQVLIGVRDTHKTSEKDPLSFLEVSQFIIKDEKNPWILSMPNITNIVYGRDVGYKVEQVELDQSIQAISATQKRKELGI